MFHVTKILNLNRFINNFLYMFILSMLLVCVMGALVYI